MNDRLTLQEAARIYGINESTLRVAIFQGRLPAGKVAGYRGGAGNPKFLINPDDLEAFKNNHTPSPRRSWSDADIEALVELKDTCTFKQLSTYLNRSETAIIQKIQKLGMKRSVEGSRTPFHVPFTAVLLAKTCWKCGMLRDASYFRVMRKTDRPNFRAYDPNCYHCNIKTRRERHHRDRERDPNKDNNTGRLHKALQEATKDYATRDNSPYTLQEIDVILDTSKSTLQVALDLGRTFYAIRLQRFLHGVNDQTYSDIFPMRKKRRRSVPDSQWLIHFPNALKALQEHFQSIGDPAIWDLPDSEISNQDHRPIRKPARENRERDEEND